MSRSARHLITAVLTAGAAIVLPVTVGTPAIAAAQTTPVAKHAHADACAEDLDGFAVRHLPDGLGDLISNFAYEWGDVAFRSRVWETGPDDAGGYRVDLTIKVLRGPHLADRETLRDFLAEYYERDPETWDLRPYRHHGDPGYLAADEAFWSVEPGVAVSVRIATHLTTTDLIRTAGGVLPS